MSGRGVHRFVNFFRSGERFARNQRLTSVVSGVDTFARIGYGHVFTEFLMNKTLVLCG
jgi:hypothetical protein